jgi:hypothetical protein
MQKTKLCGKKIMQNKKGLLKTGALFIKNMDINK